VGEPDETVPRPTGPIGVIVPNVGLDEPPRAADLIGLARTAADAGVGAVWTVDHLYWHTPLIDALTTLGLIAGAIGEDGPPLGTAVLQPLLRPTPLLARQLLSLHQACGRRLLVGVGSGAHRGEYRALGVDDAERPARLDAAIDELRERWAGEHAHRRYRLEPRVEPAPAIWVGGGAPGARRRAAARGDAWFPMALGPERLAAELPHLRAEAEAAGRDPAGVALAAVVLVAVGADDEDLDATTAQGTAALGTIFRITQGAARGLLTAGRPADVAAEVRRHLDVGVDHVALLPIAPRPEAVVDRLLPHLEDLLSR
jgi:alkanesulfonate monooxygenase SsuD/methylene tetrahydromethanopterin reductase-like flavin-dependent oxidoreductase (luciferase family)